MINVEINDVVDNCSSDFTLCIKILYHRINVISVYMYV